MGNNICIGQLTGPFDANVELLNIIKEKASIPVKYIKHLGIQAEEGCIININNKECIIGTTGIYEIGNTEILSLSFKNNVNNNVIIDYTIE